MGYCTSCGAYIPDGQSKCLACGFDENAEKEKASASSGGGAAAAAAKAPQQERKGASVSRRTAANGPRLNTPSARRPKRSRREILRIPPGHRG